MQVTLSIADDRELRQHIRNCIAGEVRSIARGEIKTIIAEVASQKVIPSSPSELEAIVRQIITEEVKAQLGTKRYMDPTWIQIEARRQIAEFIRAQLAAGKGV